MSVAKDRPDATAVSQTVTIVGASARAAAASAVRAGFAVRAGDLFADVDLGRICQSTRVERYPAGLREVVGGPQPGGWLYTGALENHPALVDALAALRPLYGNCGRVLRAVRDPRRLSQALASVGLDYPAIATDPADAVAPGRGFVNRLPPPAARIFASGMANVTA